MSEQWKPPKWWDDPWMCRHYRITKAYKRLVMRSMSPERKTLVESVKSGEISLEDAQAQVRGRRPVKTDGAKS